MTTKAQLRAEAAERKNLHLAAENNRLTTEVEHLSAHAQRATGFTYTLSDPRSLIRVQPDGFGHWALFLHSPSRGAAWTGTQWGPLNADYTELYRWELAQALAEVDRLVADDAAEHQQWRKDRKAAAEQGTPIHDALTAVA